MATKVKTHSKMVDEILKIINDNENVSRTLVEAFKVPYFRGYMELAVSDQWPTIDVNEINFKQYEYHRSMAGATLLNRQTFNIINSVIMNPDAKDSTKTIHFKALSEMLYVGESNVLTAIFNKDITKLYPNITFQSINEALSYGN